ncbi:uncharacterized protein E0L32_004185 [Thyridium curvatum]|uniref:Lipoprotein n=1 Tax=Thyridium curvatum TaxID=1093900 RepID=A0A507BHZ1_9PEZI|nr:uncharacterized protein E0L32_004185 [Thyridium curvatum]TPX16190.1 hypothetical protein E0L32_004185 [Thyridium curvatum]
MRITSLLAVPVFFSGALATICGCSNSGIAGVNQGQSDACKQRYANGASDACEMYQGKCLYPKYAAPRDKHFLIISV